METQTREDVAASHTRRSHGVVWGLAEGLILNVAIFILIFASPWIDDHVYNWLDLTFLYAGPVIVGLAGLTLIVSGHARRRGVGLVLSAPITVALWFAWASIDTAIAVSANTPGG
jgi:hypothetical protein